MPKRPKNNEEAKKELAQIDIEISDEDLEKYVGGSFISYEMLKMDLAVSKLVRLGQLITISDQPANPYSRGCSEIDGCRD